MSTTTTLADLPPETTKTIANLAGDPVLVARLRELGFIVGADVKVVGRAPFGEPVLVEIRGSTVALRKAEARCVHL